MTSFSQTEQRVSTHKSLITIFLGNLFEHYDNALFGFLAPFLAPLFFPHSDPIVSLLMAYALYPMSLFSRPIGALFFGLFGDRFGRKKALLFSLSGMALVTTMMGFIPTYAKIGFLAPSLLLLGKILQGFFASGEYAGGIVYSLEATKKEEHQRIATFYNGSTLLGIFLASFFTALSIRFFPQEMGFRVPFFIGSFTGFVSLLGRFRLEETQIEFPSFSLQEVKNELFHHKKMFFLLVLVSGFNYANYSVAMILMNALVPLCTTITKMTMMEWNSFFLALDLFLLLFFGLFFQNMNPRKILKNGSLVCLFFSLPLFSLIPHSSFFLILMIRFLFVLFGVIFSIGFYPWTHEIIPEKYRYTFFATSYAIGSQILGAPTTFFSLFLYKQTGSVCFSGIYWFFLACLVFLALSKTKWKKTVELVE